MESERRLHPLSFLFVIQNTVRQFIVPLVLGLFAARGLDAWEMWAAVGFVPVALTALARALSVRYRFEPTELVIKTGFIFRRVRHIPYDRVQNVDAVQNLLHRAFDVIEVRIETGGGAETEAALQVVDRRALDEIRGHVFANRPGAAPVDQAVAAADVLLAMPPREVFLFGLIHGRGMLVAGALFGLLWEFRVMDRVIGAEARGRGFFRSLARGFYGDVTVPFQQIVVGLAALVLLLAVFRLASAIWSFLGYYGFTVTRAGEDLRCEYGLLKRVTSTIPVRRIQKVTVREGPWHRYAHRVSVGVQTAGGKAGEAEGSTRSWLAPLVREQDLPHLLAGIAPEATADVVWQGVHPKGVRRALFGLLFLVVPVSAVLVQTFGAWAWLIVAALVAWAVVHARRSVAALRWAVGDDSVQFKSGWIWRNRLVAPLTKVQVVSRHQSPFDRRHRMTTVFADTAGRTLGDYAIRIPYLATPVAAALAEQLSSAAARTSFRW